MGASIGTQFQYSTTSWWLCTIAELDAGSPGLCGALLRASPHRKHVAATVLAHRRGNELMDSPELVSQLVTGRLDVLLADALGSNPSGLLGCLRRLSFKIEPPSFYRKLFNISCDPAHREVACALRHVAEVNESMLDVAISAPAILLHTGAFRAISNVGQRADLMAAIETIIELTGASSASIDQSLRSLGEHGSIIKFIDGWLGKARFPQAPAPPSDEIFHITTASELHCVAAEFENCMVNFRLDILCGREAFYRCTTPFGPMVGRIGRDDSDQPWEFLGTHARQNRQPPREACAWVEARFAEIGIRLPAHRPERPERWQVFERLLDPWFDEFDDLVIDEPLAA